MYFVPIPILRVYLPQVHDRWICIICLKCKALQINPKTENGDILEYGINKFHLDSLIYGDRHSK
jgi:hypothetical protein